jgi:hypothetical protein
MYYSSCLATPFFPQPQHTPTNPRTLLFTPNKLFSSYVSSTSPKTLSNSAQHHLAHHHHLVLVALVGVYILFRFVCELFRFEIHCLFATNAVCFECAFFLSFVENWIVLPIRGKQERSVKLRVDTWISGSLHTRTLLLLLILSHKRASGFATNLHPVFSSIQFESN